MNDEFVFCIVCMNPRDMDKNGMVEKCEQCGDGEYVRSDYYVPDGNPFYGYIQPTKAALQRRAQAARIEAIGRRNDERQQISGRDVFFRGQLKAKRL